MEKSESTEHSEFLNRYSILIDDIKYLKSRQWTITYYLLLLYAAIIGFCKLMGFDDGTGYGIEKSVLIILTFLIAALTLFINVFFSQGLLGTEHFSKALSIIYQMHSAILSLMGLEKDSKMKKNIHLGRMDFICLHFHSL